VVDESSPENKQKLTRFTIYKINKAGFKKQRVIALCAETRKIISYAPLPAALRCNKDKDNFTHNRDIVTQHHTALHSTTAPHSTESITQH
jgi:hypothetical protein